MNADELLSQTIGDDVGRWLDSKPGLGLAVVGAAVLEGSGHDAFFSASFVRDLTEEDMVIQRETKLGSVTPAIKRIKDTHHTLARLIAEGKRGVEISAITGFSQSRISILKNDPAFAELIEFYREQVGGVYLNVHERISAVAIEATAELHHRLVEEPEAVKTSELIEIAKFAHDRTGFGPTTKSVSKNVSLTLNGADIAAMKAEVEGSLLGNVQTINRAALPADQRPALGHVEPDSAAGDRGGE